jgi:hypothetical protein
MGQGGEDTESERIICKVGKVDFDGDRKDQELSYQNGLSA